MRPDEFEDVDRRTFVKGAAAAGVAATGVGAVSGNVAAQQANLNADPLFGSGLVVVQGVNVQAPITVQNVDVSILQDVDVDIDVQDVNVLNNNVIKILNDVTVTNVLNRNQVTVEVNILSGDVVLTDVVNVPGNLQA